EIVNRGSPPADIEPPAIIDLAVTTPEWGALILKTPLSGLALYRLRWESIFSLFAFKMASSLSEFNNSRWDEIPSSNIACVAFKPCSATFIWEAIVLDWAYNSANCELLNSAKTCPFLTSSPREK